MGANRAANGGSRAGVSGIFSLTTGQQFTGDVYQWAQSLSIPEIDRSGRGGPRWAQMRRLNVGSTISFRMNAGGNGFPAPIGWQNAGGSIVLTYDNAKKCTINGEVIAFDCQYDAGKGVNNSGSGENWDVAVTMRITAEPAYSGFPGTQQTPSTRVFGDQETDQGLSKTLDPNNLATAATRRIDVGTIGDSNTAEIAKLSAYVTSAVPIPNLKYRPSTLHRTDRGGVVLDLNFGLTNTYDDQVNPHKTNLMDPNQLVSQFASAILKNPASSIAAPTPPAHYRLFSTTDYILNDLETKRVWEFRQKDSKDEYLLPRQFVETDPKGLTGHAMNAYMGSAPPIQSGFQIRSTRTDNVTAFATMISVEGGLTNTEQDIIFPRSRRLVDVWGIESYATSASIPAGTIPAVETFLTSANTEYFQITPGKYLSVKRMDTLNSVERREVVESISTRSGQEFTNRFGLVIASTQTDADEADAQFAVYDTFSDFDSLSVKGIDKRYKMLVVNTRDVGIKVEFISGEPAGRWLPAILLSGAINVYLIVQTISGSLKQVTHKSLWYKSKVRRRFIVWRWYSQSTPIPDNATLAGTVNNATFLGLAAGTVMFLRARGTANYQLGSNTPMYIGYEFETDDAGFYDYQGYQDETFYTTASVSTGFNAVSAFTDGEIAVQTPSSSDFSVFTS